MARFWFDFVGKDNSIAYVVRNEGWLQGVCPGHLLDGVAIY